MLKNDSKLAVLDSYFGMIIAFVEYISHFRHLIHQPHCTNII